MMWWRTWRTRHLTLQISSKMKVRNPVHAMNVRVQNLSVVHKGLHLCVICPQQREPQQTSCLRRKRARKKEASCLELTVTQELLPCFFWSSSLITCVICISEVTSLFNFPLWKTTILWTKLKKWLWTTSSPVLFHLKSFTSWSVILPIKI